MWERFRRWRTDIPIADPLRREQAGILQAFLFLLIGAVFLGSLSLLTAQSEIDRIVGLISSALLGIVLIASVIVLRRGGFLLSVMLFVIGNLALIAVNMAPTGLEGSRAIFTMMTVPIVLAGLLGGRRILTFSIALSILIVVGIALLERAAPQLVGYSTETYDPAFTTITFILVVAILGPLIDQFGRALITALTRAQGRERELEALRLSLEQQVAERTAELQSTVNQLRTSQATIDDLGAPILPVLPGVLTIPLIGTIDQARARKLTEKLLAAVSEQRARIVIFDLTGVASVDTQIAQALLQAATSVELLGAQAAIAGMSPVVAQTVVALGITFHGITIYASLQDAIMAIQSAAS
jgi:anti-anti-sigma regulatory factor